MGGLSNDVFQANGLCIHRYDSFKLNNAFYELVQVLTQG